MTDLSVSDIVAVKREIRSRECELLMKHNLMEKRGCTTAQEREEMKKLVREMNRYTRTYRVLQAMEGGIIDEIIDMIDPGEEASDDTLAPPSL